MDYFVFKLLMKKMIHYGSISQTFNGYCTIKNGKLDCITQDQQDERSVIFIIGAIIFYLIYYRLTH